MQPFFFPLSTSTYYDDRGHSKIFLTKLLLTQTHRKQRKITKHTVTATYLTQLYTDYPEVLDSE